MRFPDSEPRANSTHISVGKPSVAAFLAYRRPVPPFGFPISDVVGICTKKEVIGINAFRIVAAVEDEHTVWYLAVTPHPCQTVRAHRPMIRHREMHRAILPVWLAVSGASGPFQTSPAPFCFGVESTPEIRRERRDGDKLSFGHLSLRQGSVARVGMRRHSVAPARFYFSRSNK